MSLAPLSLSHHTISPYSTYQNLHSEQHLASGRPQYMWPVLARNKGIVSFATYFIFQSYYHHAHFTVEETEAKEVK